MEPPSPFVPLSACFFLLFNVILMNAKESKKNKHNKYAEISPVLFIGEHLIVIGQFQYDRSSGHKKFQIQ
jgi:hypothetical protein